MQLHFPRFEFVRRHAIGIVVMFVLVGAYFASVGWVGTKLRDDLGHTLQAAPTVDDHGHRAN